MRRVRRNRPPNARSVTTSITPAICAVVLGIASAAPAHADVTPSPSAPVDTSTLLDPTSDSALLNLLGQQGVAYFPETDIDAVLEDADPRTTLVISDDERPDATILKELPTSGFGRVVILNNDTATISAFMVGARVGKRISVAAPVDPSCAQPDAAAAGTIDLHSSTATFDLSATDDTVDACYLVGGAPTMINGILGATDIVAIGSTTFFENDRLASAGNAALALRIFGANPKLVWFAPQFVPDPSLNNCGGMVCTGGTPAPGSTTTIPAGGGGGGEAAAVRARTSRR